MTITNSLLLAFPISVMLLGLYLFIKGIRHKPKVTLPNDVYDKDGIPIVPRHLRQLKNDSSTPTPTVAPAAAVVDPDASSEQPPQSLHSPSQADADLHDPTAQAGDAFYAQHEPSPQYQNEPQADTDHHIDYQANHEPNNLSGKVSRNTSGDETDMPLTPNFLDIDEDTDDWLMVNLDTEQSSHRHDNEHERASDETGVDIPLDAEIFLDDRGVNGISEVNNANDADTDHLYDVVYASNEQYAEYDVSDETDVFSHLASSTQELEPTVQTASVPEFAEASPILDEHLTQDNAAEQDSPLTNASGNLNISILPVNEFGFFRGRTLLNLIDKFGFKFGTMNMFHRYQNKDGTGILWFSMMALTVNGVEPFDLNELPNAQLKGVVLFLSLPHPKMLQGFDSMMSIANLLARELGGYVVDEHGEMMTKEYKISLRSQLQDIENLENP